MLVLRSDLPFVRLKTVDSTQAVAADFLKRGEPVGAILALEQTAGKGRFGRTWHSPPGECLALSLVLPHYADHPKPYLLGMGLAVAAACAFACHVQWPNDIVNGGRKVGGILTELHPDAQGRLIPVIGIGMNLNQTEFPDDIRWRATSLRLITGDAIEPEAAARQLLEAAEALPELNDWAELQPFWMPVDDTPGKRYRLLDGQEVVGTGIGPNGELQYRSEMGSGTVMAADAV